MEYSEGTLVRIKGLFGKNRSEVGVVMGYMQEHCYKYSEDGFVADHDQNSLANYRALKVRPYDQDFWSSWTGKNAGGVKEFLYVQDKVVNRFIQPLLFQFNDLVVNKVGDKYRIVKVNWEGGYNVGKKRVAIARPELRGLKFFLQPVEKHLRSNFYSLADMKQFFDLAE